MAAKKKTSKKKQQRVSAPAAKAATHVMLSVDVPMSQSEPLCEALWDLGVLGVTTEDVETRARPYDPSIPKTGLATVKGTFEVKRGMQARVLAGIQGFLTAGKKAKVDPNVRWEDVEDKDWSTEWKKSWAPLAVGARIWIVPTWERAS